MSENDRALRMDIVEWIAAEAMARTFLHADDMRAWTQAMMTETEQRARARGVTTETYVVAWEKMLTLIRRQFAIRPPALDR